MTDDRGDTVRMFLDALRDSDELQDIKKRFLLLTSEKMLSKDLLSVYAPGAEALKNQTRADIARELANFMLENDHIQFLERDGSAGPGLGDPEALYIRGTIEIVRPTIEIVRPTIEIVRPA